MEDKLFFRVWRDLYLNKKINEYLKVNRINGNSFRSDEIISCYWLVKNNHLDLLFKKVIASEYLVFNEPGNIDYGQTNNHWSYFNTDNFKKSWVFKSYEFYSNLLTNYSNYFTSNKSILKSTLITFIKYDLYIGVQVMFDKFIDMEHINEYSTKEKEITGLNYLILKSISNHSLNTLNTLNVIRNNSNGSVELSSSSTELSIWRKIFSNNYYGSPRLNQPIKLYGLLEYLINKMNIKLPINQIPSKISNGSGKIVSYHFLNLRLFDKTVSTLLDCCMIISLMGDYLKPFLIKLSNKSYTIPEHFQREYYNQVINEEEPNQILSIDKLNEIKSSFKQLGILDMVISDIDITNQDIKYLYKLVIPFTTFDFLMENLSFYQIKYNFNYSSESIEFMDCHPSSISPISFGDYNEIQTFKEGVYSDKVILFQYCKYDKKKQIKFINDAINNLNDNFSLTKIISIEKLYRLLFEIDNIEFIQYVYSQLSNINYSLPRDVFSLIKSIDTFDFIYNCNGIDKSKFTIKTLEEVNIKNNKIIQHFKSFYATDYHLMVQICLNKLYQLAERNEISISTVVYSIEKGLLNLYYFTTIWFSIKLSELSVTQIIWLIENTPLDKNYNLKRYYNGQIRININKILKVLHWIYENRYQDINNNRCQFDLDVFYLYHYLNNTLDSILKQPLFSKTFPKNSKLVFTEIAIRNDSNSLELIISKYYKDEVNQYLENGKSELNHLFFEAAKYGSISIFKHIVKNYSFLLQIHQPSKFNKLFQNQTTANPTYKLTKSNLDTIQLLYNSHVDLQLYFKNTILLKPIQSSNIYIEWLKK